MVQLLQLLQLLQLTPLLLGGDGAEAHQDADGPAADAAAADVVLVVVKHDLYALERGQNSHKTCQAFKNKNCGKYGALYTVQCKSALHQQTLVVVDDDFNSVMELVGVGERQVSHLVPI